MKVYPVILEECGYEFLLSICSTKEKAEEFVKVYIEKVKYLYRWINTQDGIWVNFSSCQKIFIGERILDGELEL